MTIDIDGSLWRHNKTGNTYMVVCSAIECTNGREDIPYVIYKAVGSGLGKIFIREKEEFYSKFTKL